MISFVKKWIGRILTSNLIYMLVVKGSVKDGFLNTKNGYIKVENQSPYLLSLIYFGLYEKAEINLIERYLNADLPVVELGASIGMTTIAICNKVSICKVVSIEANPLLILGLNSTKNKNGLHNLSVISKAIDYSGVEHIGFYIDNRNLGSHKTSDVDAVKVVTAKLADIVKGYNLTDYNLVCDIEGAELEMFLMERDIDTIKRCRQIIIELHSAVYEGETYSPQNISSIVCERFQMEIVAREKNTWVFRKKI